MLDHGLVQRRAASLFCPHRVHRGDLAEQALDGTVLSLVPGVFIHGEPFHCLFIAFRIVHEQVGRHGADGGVEMLIHEAVRAVLEDFHLRT